MHTGDGDLGMRRWWNSGLRVRRLFNGGLGMRRWSGGGLRMRWSNRWSEDKEME